MPTSTSAALTYTVGSWISARTATYSLPKPTPRRSRLCSRTLVAARNLSGSLPASQVTCDSGGTQKIWSRYVYARSIPASVDHPGLIVLRMEGSLLFV